jgi:Family of unknown function (DUF5759)
MDRPPQLNVSELYGRRISKDTARLKAYNQILDSIYSRIRNQSKLPNSPANLLYTIPPFILGLPRIDLEDCVVYLVYQLRQNGFEVKYSYPNLLGISWQHHERNYILEQSPIMQAMLVTSNSLKEKQHSRVQKAFDKKPKKDKKKVSVAENTNVIISPYALDNSSPSVGRGPQASDYQPPQDFLKQMEAPEPKKTTGNTNSSMSTSGVLADLWKL